MFFLDTELRGGTIMYEYNGYKFHKISDWHMNYIKENHHLKMSELKEATGIKSDETICRMLEALGIERERHYARKLPNTPEVIADLKNPYLSHVKIADKYGVHETAVGHRRKAIGVSVRRNMGPTRLEDEIESVLDELDLAYIPQKQIKQWSIDFYLGRKYCIDVHGEWAHTRKKMPERDARKRQELEEMGYKYLVIHESEIENAKNTIQDFASQGFPPQ